MRYKDFLSEIVDWIQEQRSRCCIDRRKGILYHRKQLWSLIRCKTLVLRQTRYFFNIVRVRRRAFIKIQNITSNISMIAIILRVIWISDVGIVVRIVIFCGKKSWCASLYIGCIEYYSLHSHLLKTSEFCSVWQLYVNPINENVNTFI